MSFLPEVDRVPELESFAAFLEQVVWQADSVFLLCKKLLGHIS